MLSFDITDRNIRIIKGAESGGKIRISSAATLNVDENVIVNGHVKDVPRLATQIHDRLKSNRMNDKEAIISISSNLTIFKELNIPNAKESEFAKTVKAEMQTAVGIDESYNISYIKVGPAEEGALDARGMKLPEGSIKVLATACPYEIVDCYKKVFVMLDISLKSMIVGCNCITKVLLSDPKVKEKMPLLAVQIDNNFISLNIYERGQLSFSRFASIDRADYDNSSDYVFEAVNENIFRMMQFQKTRNPQNPIQNVVFYGDTTSYIRLTRDLEQMDIATSVINVPPNVSGYQNLEFSAYANAIGAMFKRNKDYEKINLLEYGGATAVLSETIKSGGGNYGALLAITTGAALLLMGAIYMFGFRFRSNSLTKQIEEINTFLNSAEVTTAKKDLPARRKLYGNVLDYAGLSLSAKLSLDSTPVITREVYEEIENTVKEVSEMKDEVPGDTVTTLAPYSSPDYFYTKIMDIKYMNGELEFNIECEAEEFTPKYPSKLYETFVKKGYFDNVVYDTYSVEDISYDEYGQPLSGENLDTVRIAKATYKLKMKGNEIAVDDVQKAVKYLSDAKTKKG